MFCVRAENERFMELNAGVEAHNNWQSFVPLPQCSLLWEERVASSSESDMQQSLHLDLW